MSSECHVEEMQQPFEEKGVPPPPHVPRGRGEVVLMVVGSAIGFALFGYDTGVVSGAADWAERDLGLTPVEKGVAVGATCIAAAFSCITAPYLNTRIGRKPVIMVTSTLYTFGAGVIAVSQAFFPFALGRFFLGVAIGMATVTIPLYVAECSPPHHRGKLVALNDLCVCAGQVLAGMVNVLCKHYGHNWRASMGVAACPAVLQLALFTQLNESPRWLVQNGDVDEARRVFRRIRGDEAEEELERMVTEAQGHSEEPFAAMWSHPPYRRAVAVGVVLMVLNQASGINTVMYYSAGILEHAGFSESMAIWGALLCDVVQTLGVAISLYFVDTKGRRAMALTSAFLVAPAISTLGLSFVVGVRELSIAALMAYLMAFGLGLSGIPWTMNSEIYPLPIRNAAQGQAVFTNWFLNGLIALVFPVFIDKAVEAFFFFFGAVALCGGLWMHRFLPETRGLSLEDMTALFAAPLQDGVRQTSSSSSSSSAVPPHH
eukprot:Sspe_Gene.27944::Locus_12393_Transcript_1_1_Confidence_1.000_Length_1587::g.27944::m.27944